MKKLILLFTACAMLLATSCNASPNETEVQGTSTKQSASAAEGGNSENTGNVQKEGESAANSADASQKALNSEALSPTADESSKNSEQAQASADSSSATQASSATESVAEAIVEAPVSPAITESSSAPAASSSSVNDATESAKSEPQASPSASEAPAVSQVAEPVQSSQAPAQSSAVPEPNPELTAAPVQSKYKDGTFKGVAWGYESNIVMEVTISGDVITDIRLVEHADDDIYVQDALLLIPKAIAAQSADVDAISGATATSAGIKDAIKEALAKAAN